MSIIGIMQVVSVCLAHYWSPQRDVVLLLFYVF